MTDSSADQKRPLWVRLAMYPPGPREFHVMRCRLTVPMGIFFSLSVGIGFYWYYGDALKANPRGWLGHVIFSILVLLAILPTVLLATWLHFAVRWMDRNQQW